MAGPGRLEPAGWPVVKSQLRTKSRSPEHYGRQQITDIVIPLLLSQGLFPWLVWLSSRVALREQRGLLGMAGW